MLRIVSWNVNGLRACIKKGFYDVLGILDADIICIQETKLGTVYPQIPISQYDVIWNSADRKGYSGTAILTRIKPIRVMTEIPGHQDSEGRIIVVEYENFILVNCYAPHSRRDLSRLGYKREFNRHLLDILSRLSTVKPVVLCGDLNVAHKEIDLKNSKANCGNAGFTAVERKDMDMLLGWGFIDSFRYKYPDRIVYTWWSYRKDVRKRNIGWRIDYCIISDVLKSRIIDCYIWDDAFGSDHCPIGIDLEVEV